MKRFRRTQRLGEDYTIERIQERIETETLRSVARAGQGHAPRIVGGSVRRHRRPKLTGLQKRYFARLYRIGKLKKRPYSQVWRYREDIRKMKKLQNQYLFLAREDITTVPELQNAVQALTARQRKRPGRKAVWENRSTDFRSCLNWRQRWRSWKQRFIPMSVAIPFLRKSIRIMRCVRRPWRKRDISMRKSARSGSGLPGSMRKRLPGNGSSTGN